VVHVLSGLWPGGAVLSKAARPKSAAPVSLAGFQPPAAAADPRFGSEIAKEAAFDGVMVRRCH